MPRQFTDLWLGARLALSGGIDSRLRTTLTTVGVALGVVLLLFASSTPRMVGAHSDRVAARAPLVALHNPRLLMLPHNVSFRGDSVSGWAVEKAGRGATLLPPGVKRLPGPHQVVVSPALRELLRTPGVGAGLERQLGNARVVGTIAQPGLGSPAELYAYLGATGLRQLPDTEDVAGFGQTPSSEFSGPGLTLLVILMVVALLLPIGTFVATATRFGSSERNRRLAALRLVGADRAMTARIAAGEALLGSVAGVVIGALLFFAGLKPLIGHVTVAGMSVFPSDVQPTAALLVLSVVLVPAAAVLFALFAMRRVAVEPLGVTRRGRERRRRLWWRLLTPVLGFALLAPLVGSDHRIDTTSGTIETVAGVILVLVGVCALLPWVVEAVVTRSGTGPVPWLLAVRRLQSDHGTTGRVVGAIGLAVAGAIALQTVFGGVQASAQLPQNLPSVPASLLTPLNGVSVSGAVVKGPDALSDLSGQLQRIQGVKNVYAVSTIAAHSSHPVTVASCPTLRMLPGVRGCSGSMIFLAQGGDGVAGDPDLRPGQQLRIGNRSVTLPPGTRTVRISQSALSGYLPFSTPLLTAQLAQRMRLGSGGISALVVPRNAGHDLQQPVENVMAGIAPLAVVSSLREDNQLTITLRKLQNVLTAGAVAVLIVIGFSLLMSVVEQLRERRQVLAVLSAFGTRASTLAWSVVFQTALLIVTGLVLAVAVGALLGVMLMHILALPTAINAGAIALLAGAGLLVVAALTVLTLPMLWLHSRPDGLRTE